MIWYSCSSYGNRAWPIFFFNESAQSIQYYSDAFYYPVVGQRPAASFMGLRSGERVFFDCRTYSDNRSTSFRIGNRYRKNVRGTFAYIPRHDIRGYYARRSAACPPAYSIWISGSDQICTVGHGASSVSIAFDSHCCLYEYTAWSDCTASMYWWNTESTASWRKMCHRRFYRTRFCRHAEDPRTGLS